MMYKPHFLRLPSVFIQLFCFYPTLLFSSNFIYLLQINKNGVPVDSIFDSPEIHLMVNDINLLFLMQIFILAFFLCSIFHLVFFCDPVIFGYSILQVIQEILLFVQAVSGFR